MLPWLNQVPLSGYLHQQSEMYNEIQSSMIGHLNNKHQFYSQCPPPPSKLQIQGVVSGWSKQTRGYPHLQWIAPAFMLFQLARGERVPPTESVKECPAITISKPKQPMWINGPYVDHEACSTRIFRGLEISSLLNSVYKSLYLINRKHIIHVQADLNNNDTCEDSGSSLSISDPLMHQAQAKTFLKHSCRFGKSVQQNRAKKSYSFLVAVLDLDLVCMHVKVLGASVHTLQIMP